jgi:hypothetical protein
MARFRMLQDVDKEVISSWHGWRTGTSLEYAQSWGSWPEPRINEGVRGRLEPPSAGDLTGIPDADLSRIGGILKEAGQKITPANIRHIYEQEKTSKPAGTPPNLEGHRGFVADMIKRSRPEVDVTDEMIDKQIKHINKQLKDQGSSKGIEDLYMNFKDVD